MKVIDGDTIEVRNDSKDVIRIRLNGIDCSEMGQPFGGDATEELRAMIGGKTVQIIPFGEEQLGRGKRWMRSHRFNTMALTIVPKSFDPHEYKAANMTTVLAWKTNTGLLEEGVSVGLP